MKWIETDLWWQGEKFTIVGLELYYDQLKLNQILKGIDEMVRTILE